VVTGTAATISKTILEPILRLLLGYENAALSSHPLHSDLILRCGSNFIFVSTRPHEFPPTSINSQVQSNEKESCLTYPTEYSAADK
jgi:hypothetical protein